MKDFSCILCLFVLFHLFSCDNVLDIEPENDVTFTNYFKTEKDAAALLYGIHVKLNDVLSGCAHDIIGMKVDVVPYDWAAARELSPSYFASIDGVPPSWKTIYALVYRCNLLLDNLYRFENVSKERLEYYKMQACFAKGVAYFWLARQWGEVPIISSSTVIQEYPKKSIEEVLNEAIRNAEIALDLPVFDDLVDENGNKITTKQFGCKGAATALLAHIYAWKASIFNDANAWQISEGYCSDLINGKVGFYQLAANPKEVCEIVMKGNSSEGIFEQEYFIDDDPDLRHVPYAALKLLGYPVVKNATITDYMSCEIYKETVNNMYDKEDLRRDAYFFALDSVFRNEANEIIPIKRAFLQKWNFSFYQFNEWTGEDEYKLQDANRIIWRLADIILLRAECRARLDMPNAVDDLNRIRERAYGNKEHAYSESEGDLRYAIFKEREKELLFEGHRYYDVMRNGYWKTELTEVFSKMTEEEFKMGAQYFPVHPGAFVNSDVMRQNIYWSTKL